MLNDENKILIGFSCVISPRETLAFDARRDALTKQPLSVDLLSV